MSHSPCTSDCARANNCCGHQVECCKCGKVGCPSDMKTDGEFRYCDEHWVEHCRTVAEDAKECETCSFLNKDGSCGIIGRCDATHSGWVWNGEVEE